MKNIVLHGHAGSVLLVALAGCASVNPRASFEEVQTLTAERAAQDIRWRSGGPEDEDVRSHVKMLLSAPLSVDTAIQIALLENASLQAKYEELGISQADLVQAGVLQNPSVFASNRFADDPSSKANVEFGVTQDFLDLLARSSRVGVAEAVLERTKLDVADAVLTLAAETGIAYYAVLGAKQIAAMRNLTAEAAHASAELARRLHAAGNLSDRRLAIEHGHYEDARVEWAKAEAAVLAAREDLTRHMGLWGHETNWQLPEQMPRMPAVEPSLEHLESVAIERRLDLAAARREADIAARALGMTRGWRYLPGLQLGVSTERDTDGQSVTGPDLTLELPLFDRRQGDVARMESQLRQRDLEIKALAVAIRSEVRLLRDRLLATRELLEHYRDVVVPLREQIVQLTQEEFNYMLIGAFELIAAKQHEYNAYQGYLETLRDYWTTRIELERAIGGKIPGEVPEEKPEDSHHGHGG